MMRVVFLCLSLIALSVCYPYNPYCQNWCYGGQQSFVEPQLCNSYCGGYSGNCGSSYCSQQRGSQYPIVYSGSPVGPISWPGYGSGYGSGYESGYGSGFGYGQYPTYPNYPVNQGPFIFIDPNSQIVPPSNNNPLNVDTNAQKAKEWLCPADPSPRVGTTYPSQQQPQALIHCQHDENCANYPYRQKCCHDNAIGSKVCKPAVLN